MRHVHAPRGQFRSQGTHRQIGLLGKPGKKPLPGFTRKRGAAAAPDLAGNLPAPRALALTDPNRRGHGNAKPPSRRTNRIASLQRNRNSLPEVYRKWSCHDLPHHLVTGVNHETSAVGIHTMIQLVEDTL